MNTITTEEYDAFASDYHWLYSDRGVFFYTSGISRRVGKTRI
jgi:restriction endonuclease Mrr